MYKSVLSTGGLTELSNPRNNGPECSALFLSTIGLSRAPNWSTYQKTLEQSIACHAVNFFCALEKTLPACSTTVLSTLNWVRKEHSSRACSHEPALIPGVINYVIPFFKSVEQLSGLYLNTLVAII